MNSCNMSRINLEKFALNIRYAFVVGSHLESCD